MRRTDDADTAMPTVRHSPTMRRYPSADPAPAAAPLKQVGAAIDRYLAAFEKGTLDNEDEHVRARLAQLKTQCRQLRARKAQLEIELAEPPVVPAPADLDKISNASVRSSTVVIPDRRRPCSKP